MMLEEYLRKNYSATTIQGYLYIIRKYTQRQHRSEQATYAQVLDYIGQLRSEGKHPKTLRNHLFAIKIYYRYLLATGARKDHPCASLYLQDPIDRSIHVQELYPMKAMEDFARTYTPSKQHPHTQLRERVIIALLINQALTVLEIAQLDLGDIDLDKATIRINGNVKNKGRTLDLKPAQIMQLHNYIKTTRPALRSLSAVEVDQGKASNALLLRNSGQRIDPHAISRTINRARKPSEKMQPLKIRQSVITHLLKSGNDLRIVQVFAGHRVASSTEAYKQSGLEELKAVIDRLHPLQGKKGLP